MLLSLCHPYDQRVPATTRRSATMTKARRSVQWKEDMIETKIIEECDYDSESEASIPSSDQSTSSLDSTPPALVYSTRFAGLRRLTPSPHPLFPSERLQDPRTEGQRVKAAIKVDVDRSGKMASTRFSTPMANLDLALPPSSSFLRRSTDTLNESRRSSSSSSSMFRPSSCSPLPVLSSSSLAPSQPTRFSVSGTVEGVSRLEAGLEGVCALLNKTHSCQIRSLHVQTSDPMLADIVANMQHHLRTEFATFAWPRALTDRAQEILRRISVLTLVVEVTIEYVPEKESLFRRFSHQIKSVFSFFRRLR
ncbi:hypothetical protein PMAYCL1PPCAC_06008 [Pristionchus mayeri]|uniref:Uncharacterized protein n=1 Tax=Pristionchus mayeri TaxID=1317129 RepID=A0AAN4Z7E2_9BILA|nr:hypothetical protein PMAYCL1PPCAC_06008 [Pristionchus mayeri]